MGRSSFLVTSVATTQKSKEELRRVFEQYGSKVNDETRLNRENLKSAFEYLGALMPGYNAASALRYIDRDRTGYIKGDQLQALIEYAYISGYR